MRTSGIVTGAIVLGLAASRLAAADAVLPDGFAKNSPVHRGADNCGFGDFKNVPVSWSDKEGKGVLWKVKLDAPAWASPVVWGDRVVALAANQEKRTVVCMDAKTGKVQWRKDVPDVEGGTKDYKIDSMDQRWDALLHAGATPATDGKRVYALFSNAQLAALDMASGDIAWNVGIGNSADNKYGLTCAPLIFKDTVIIAMEGDTRFLAAYDTGTGKEKWKTKRQGATWASPILIATPGGKNLVVITSDPDVTAWDAETGKQAWSVKLVSGSVEYCVGPSPVYAGGMVVANLKGSGILGIDPDKGTKVWELKELEKGDISDYVSMTTDGKRVYQFFQEVLTCMDPKAGKVVKQKEMGGSSSYASPFVAGGKLYLMTGEGALVVEADPDKDFAEVGKGQISDACDSPPAVVDGMLVFRTDESVLAVGAK